ncbi:MAG: hypothetical protein IAF02_21445 [Anaerolineae bacterium]|nr:hypothetical protein [Anaerolineae bacterium]
MPEKATASSWNIKPMPEAHKELPLSGVYTEEEFEKMSYGFLPQDQQDKWFIYLEDDWLFFHRSWTGTCVFKLEIVLNNCKYHAIKAIVNRDPEQYRNTDDRQDVELISYLIDTLLLGRFATLPSPQNMSEEDTQKHQQHVMGKKDTDGIIKLPVKQNESKQ